MSFTKPRLWVTDIASGYTFWKTFSVAQSALRPWPAFTRSCTVSWTDRMILPQKPFLLKTHCVFCGSDFSEIVAAELAVVSNLETPNGTSKTNTETYFRKLVCYRSPTKDSRTSWTSLRGCWSRWKRRALHWGIGRAAGLYWLAKSAFAFLRAFYIAMTHDGIKEG